MYIKKKRNNCAEDGIIGNRNLAHLMGVAVGGGAPLFQVSVTLLTLWGSQLEKGLLFSR
jgi:hypothetical protein